MRSFIEANRPVHLARRDACVERAVELLYSPVQDMGTSARTDHVGSVIRLLEVALRHADLAARSPRTTPEEKDFVHFLRLILRNSESIRSLIQNQAHLESDDHCFLGHFIGASQDEASLSAVNYQRQAEDMLAGLWQAMRLSHAPYRGLQQQNLEALDAAERERYERAYASFRREVESKHSRPSPPAAAAS